LVNVIGFKLGFTVGVVCADVLFEALKTRVDLNLTRLDVVKLSVFKDVGRSAGVAWKLLGPEIGSDAKIRIVTSSNHHFACVSDARNGVWSNFCC
jgi:hypothetical protein